MRGELIPGVEVGRHSPVADLIEACTRDPQRRLFIFADGEWTVSDLANISRACAAELTSHGARQGDRVALVGGNTAMRLAWQFGIWWVGAVEVSVNSELRGHMLSFVLQNAEPTLIVAEREYLEHLPEMSVPRVVVEDVDVSRHAIDVDELDGLTLTHAGDDTTPMWWFNLRPSNTEPLLRLNVEAADEATMARVRDDVLTTIREA